MTEQPPVLYAADGRIGRGTWDWTLDRPVNPRA